MLQLGASESNRDTLLALIINIHCVQGPHGDTRKGGFAVEVALRKPPVSRRDTTT